MATQVVLYVGESEDRLADQTQVIDITDVLAPDGGIYEFHNLTPYVDYNVWIELSYTGGAKSVLHLGTTRVRADTTAPEIKAFSMTSDTNSPETGLVISVTVSDVV